jgi:8-oxo-dGTP diphosphatase
MLYLAHVHLIPPNTIKMTLIISLNDKDIFPEGSDTTSREDRSFTMHRKAARVIVFDQEGKLALVYNQKSGYRLLPGGGVEEGETYHEAAIRECLEEIGCAVVIEKEIGYSKDHRARIHRYQEQHCFVARLVGEKGQPETTQIDEQGIKVEWLALDDAIALLEKQTAEMLFERYNSCFNVRLHLAFLKELKLLE